MNITKTLYIFKYTGELFAIFIYNEDAMFLNIHRYIFLTFCWGNIMKFEVIYKFLLLCVLIISLLCVVISGAGLFYGWQLSMLFNIHVSFAVLLVAALLLHILNRKNKLAKINTQFADLVLHNKYPSYCNLDRLIMTFEHFSVVQIAEQLNLDLDALLKELAEGKINVKNSHSTLRENFPHNDEKIFAAITIVLQLRLINPIPAFNLKGH